MHGYSVEGWGEFFVAGAGAAAALTGLVFVALSINLKEILDQPGLPARAAGAIAMLTQALILCLLGLVPQPARSLAVEMLGVMVIGTIFGARARWQGLHAEGGPTRGQAAGQTAVLFATVLSLSLSSITLWIGSGGGLYWLVAGLFLLVLNGIVNAWVLLVEIQR